MAGIGRPADLDKLLLSKTLIYISLVILQVCSIVSISTAKINLSGKCVLFAECTNESNKTEVDIEEDPRHCDFVLYTCVVELIFLTILTPYHLFIFYKSRWDADVVENLRVRPMIFLAFVCSILGIIASGITSGGYFIQKCTHLLAETESYPKGTLIHLILDIKLTEGTLWFSTVLWIALLALSIIRHMKQKKVETSKRYALTLLENSRTNSDEVLFESKISRRS